MKVSCNEVFGPVVAVAGRTGLDQAIEMANDTQLRPAGRRLHRRPAGTALRAARELDFGGVTLNEVPTFRADQMPYGGVKESGNTREGPRFAVRGDDRAADGRDPAVAAVKPCWVPGHPWGQAGA